MIGNSKPNDELTEEETAKRRDKGLRRLLKMPPKPHAEIVGKGKTKPKPKPEKGKPK